MKKRIVVAVVLAALLAASAYAQTTDFFELVKTGVPQGIQAAISQGADVNARDENGGTPLMWAAAKNPNADVITLLLEAGADIEARSTYEGATSLMWAAEHNQNPQVITTLLEAGADIKAHTEDGRTALIWAALYNNNTEVIIVLLNAGVDANVKDKYEKKALDYVRYMSKLEGTDALKKLEEASK